MTKVLNNVKNSIMEGVKENRMIKRNRIITIALCTQGFY